MANSREHVWPDWILKRLNIRDPIRQKMGKDAEQLLPNPEKKVRAVCTQCNNGWMHSLEQSNIPLIGNLMQDMAFSLNGLQQYQIAAWAVKMSMIGDFLARGQRPLFFDQAEREQLRVATNLPMRTHVWLGRFSLPDHIGFWGVNSWSLDRTTHAYITTVLVGHLALQVVTLQCSPELDGRDVMVDAQSGPHPWPQMLINIWPTTVSAKWPPRVSFQNDEKLSVYHLARRYSYGQDIQP